MSTTMNPDYYPMNQDSIPIDRMVYNNNVDWLSGFIIRASKQGAGTHEELIAQVEKDLRSLLDQKFNPS